MLLFSAAVIYFDSRSECYRVEDFDTVRAKENALAVIECDLRSKRRAGVVITGSMSDPYNPFEKELALTRGAIELLDKYGFGVAVDTKSNLVLRDADLLRSVMRHSPAAVSFTITAADDGLCRLIESNVSQTSERLDTLEKMSGMGVPCGVLLMPVKPFINDTEENILGIAREAGRRGAKWVYAAHGFGVTLRQNQREYFFEKIDALFPGVKELYLKEYGYAYSCRSPSSDALWKAFVRECDKLGLLYAMDDISWYVGNFGGGGQLSLF